jgi:glycosyltransferase involved in cell wall biosynthesis
MTLRVGIDVSILSAPLTGIGNFTLKLVCSLVGLKENAEWALLGAPIGVDGLPEGENVLVHPVAGLMGTRRITWQQVELPRLAKQYGLQVLHCPDFSRPIGCQVPVVNTIHDLSYYAPERFFSLPSRYYKRLLTRTTVARSNRIVAVSNFTREELFRRFVVKEDKVAVIYHGIDPAPSGKAAERNEPFVLYVGTLEERKNITTLVRAFGLLRSTRDAPLRLILAGKPGRGFRKIKTEINRCPFKGSIEILGYVERETVLELYRSAEAFILPSLYEGFGLPVLEAMALGTPVICSRVASLPEIAGDAAGYFDPLNSEDLAGALDKILASPSLRAEMRQRGFERVKLFSWDECARRYYEVYRNAAGL